MFDPLDGRACGLFARRDQLPGARHLVPADVADPWPDDDIGVLQLVRSGCALHDHHRLQKNADGRLRLSEEFRALKVDIDRDDQVCAKRARRSRGSCKREQTPRARNRRLIALLERGGYSRGR